MSTALNPSNTLQSLRVDSNGALIVTGGSGGSGGDASAALQTAGNASLSSIDTKLGAAAPSRNAGATDANTTRVTPASDGIFRPGAPRSATVPVIMEVLTSATGANWAAFGGQACTSLDLVNTMSASTTPTTVAAATNLRWRYVGSSLWLPLPAGSSFLVMGITNANQVEVQRSDNSNTQIGLRAVAYP